MSARAYATYWEEPCDMARFAKEMTTLYQSVLGHGQLAS